MQTNNLVKDVLSLGGVEVPASENVDYLSILEAWIGLPSATEDWEREEMEDVAPFEPAFFSAIERLLIHTWKPDDSAKPVLLHSNPLMELECPPKQASLYHAMESIRMTRLLRYWLELNILGRPSLLDAPSSEQMTDSTMLSNALLSNPLIQIHKLANVATSRNMYSLVEALYHHLEELPFLQAQLNFYTQSLMQAERSVKSSGQALANPQARLNQYMEAQEVSTKLNQEWEEHIDALEYIIGEWYLLANTDMRRQMRSHLGSVWAQFVSQAGGGTGGLRVENTSSSAICITLKLLHRILQGSTSLSGLKSYEHLLKYHLLPLHRPSSMVLWRDQTSLLELYHEPLVQCIGTILQHNPKWIPKVIQSMTEPEIWTTRGNTPKLVLLLHEIDTYIGILPDPLENPNVLGDVWPVLLRTVGNAMASDHSRLAERALSYVKTKNFRSLLQSNFEVSTRILLSYLVKHEPSWNPTVRKMTYNVLKTLQDIDEEKFLKVSESCYPSMNSRPTQQPTIAPKPSLGSATPTQVMPPSAAKDFSLKSAMGSWKPPSTSSKSSRTRTAIPPPASMRRPKPNGAPPLAVTGVAPWSTTRTAVPSAGMRRPTGQNNPPLGVTGVAPWAMQQKPLKLKRRANEALSDAVIEESNDGENFDSIPRASRVLAFMDEIRPPEEEQGASSWSMVQMAETPTLLPNLKFHDLVFGHDLGSGAFGSVKYARLIDRSKGRSQWAEFAVKNISTEKIHEMGYEMSVQREIAALRVLSHPGISRLISSFRFREGVYLVLEYASGGDLHTMLRKNGSLDQDSARFVIGEVIAALVSIHDLGFVYGDLKPENLVITESGHIKLTDFGGCRPVTAAARELLRSAAKNILKDLRDGDWKPQKKSTNDEEGMIANENENVVNEEGTEMEEDLRIEGTTAYLPPEVVMGAFPSPSADSWALGCVLYQCLSGRPPILEDDEKSTRNKIVSFGCNEPQQNDEDQLFGTAHGSAISAEARSLILALLKRIPTERPNMEEAAKHSFFMDADVDVFTLYSKPALALDVGTVTPAPDAKWVRRQFSSIWAPQPQSYDISIAPRSSQEYSGANSKGPISEGDEASSFFSKLGEASMSSTGSATKIPLPAKRIVEEN